MSCRFVVLSDTHFTAPPSSCESTWWNRTTERFSECMGEALVRLVRKLDPDFVVHCGDLVGVCSGGSFDFGAAVMDRFGCPWYAVPGNHDTWCSAPRARLKERYGITGQSCSYVRDLGGLRFFFLDTAYWYGYDGSVSPVLDREKYDSGAIKSIGPAEADKCWLENGLVRSEMPAVLVTHAPVAFREAYPAATLPGGLPVESPLTYPRRFIDDMIGREELLSLVRGSTAVKACFAGHWHIHDALKDHGVWHIMTAALREYPYEIRLVEFNAGVFEMSTHELDLPELRELSYVKEWGNRWVRGEKNVRFLKCVFR
ncbi:metallophosphoesterase [bacterium]|nr:metallophosphoesterase [bacterium]